MGNQMFDVSRQETDSCECMPKRTDQQAIEHALLTEDGRIAEDEATSLCNRYRTLKHEYMTLVKNEPFRKYYNVTDLITNQTTTQLRIVGRGNDASNSKIMLFQFVYPNDVFLQFEEGTTATYPTSEATLRKWLFSPELHQTHRLVITVVHEAVRSDNIFFVIKVKMELDDREDHLKTTPTP